MPTVKPYVTIAIPPDPMLLTQIAGGKHQKSVQKDKMEIDILQYKPVIASVLGSFNIPRDKEDMIQECYLALLEKQHHLEKGLAQGLGEKYAAVICRSRVIDVLKERSSEPRLNSLSEPRTKHQADKVADLRIKEPSLDLKDAILGLPPKESRAVYGMYVEGKTDVEMAVEEKVDPRSVRRRREKGLNKLKTYFEV